MSDATHVKIRFELEQDEDGWPPVATERLWAVDLGHQQYRVDNIPFYAKGVSDGDIIAAAIDEADGSLTFDHVITPSGQSTYRLIVMKEEEVQQVRDELRAMSCSSELSDLPRMFAVDIPAEVDIQPVARYLEAGEQDGRWEFEEGALRHSNSGFTYLSS